MTTETTTVEDRKLITDIREAVGYPYPETAVAAAKELCKTGKAPSIETITPEVAAVIFDMHNGKNRDLSVSKAMHWRDDMAAGEWKLNHQGIAFYANGDLADGQHRMAGCALSGKPIQFLVVRDFDESAMDTIDIGKARTAGDALELKGIADGKRKSSIAKAVEEYLHQCEFGTRPRLSIAKIEQAVIDFDDELTDALRMGSASVENVTVPALTASEASTVCYLLIRGGYTREQVTGFIASLQQGIATYPQSPTVDLNGQFTRARSTEKRAHKLNKTAKLALCCKGIRYWTEGNSVSRLKFSARESLPEPTPPQVAAA